MRREETRGAEKKPKKDESRPMSVNRGTESLFEESIHSQLDSLRRQQVPRGRDRRKVSILALLVAGGMVLSILIRFLLGL